MNEDELQRTLERLAARLERIEAKLDMPPPVEPTEAVRADRPAKTIPAHVRPVPPVPPTSPPKPVAKPKDRKPDLAARLPGPPGAGRPDMRAADPGATGRSLPVPGTRAGTPPAAPVAPRRASLEIRIGQNWMAWVGAIVIVIGTGFLVRLGYTEGWWAVLSPLTRCLLVAAFGAIMVVGGELALRRIGVAASVGLFGAGLGTLYVDCYAAFAWFETAVVSREWAFTLMALVALLGFGITLHTRFVAIGVLSIIGGYLTPWLLRGDASHVVEIGAFLTMLLGISLALSAAHPKSFRALRYVAMGAQAVVGLGWVIGAIEVNWVAALVLVAVWWAMILAEVLLAARRGQSAIGNVIAIVLSTAWFVIVGGWVLAESQPPGFDWLGTFTLSAGVVAASLAAIFGPPLRGLSRPKNAVDGAAIALWAQAAVLLAVAVALQFDGFGQSIGWLAIALAAIEISRRLRLAALDIFGLVVGALALARVALLDRGVTPLSNTLLELAQVTFTGWSLLAVAAIIATHVAAHRLRDVWTNLPMVLAALATVGWLEVCVIQCRELTMTGAWLAAVVALIALQRFGRRQRYLEIGLLTLWATAGKWLLVDAVMRRAAPDWDPTALVPVLNWQMGMAAAIVLVGWWASRVVARRSSEAVPAGYAAGSGGWQVIFIIGSAFLLVGLSFELDRIVEALQAGGRRVTLPFDQLRGLLFTMLWAMGSVAIGIVARSLVAGRGDALAGRGPTLLVRFAWVVLIVCAVKWLFGDTLYWAIKQAGTGAWPLLNLQMLAGVVVAGSAILLGRLTLPPGGRAAETSPRLPFVASMAWGAWVTPAAALLLLWGLSFEVDRAIGRAEAAAGWSSPWSALHLRMLWLTLLWGAGGLAMMLWTRLRVSASMLVVGWAVLAMSAVTWLSFDTVGLRMSEGAVAAAIVVNLQFFAGAVTVLMLAVAMWIVRAGAAPGALPVASTVRFALALVGLIGLWLGSLEIDRFFSPGAGRVEANVAMVRQTGLSIYWGLYAVVLVALGFGKRSAACRYAGLALLALTLVKVVAVDLSEVDRVWRVVSFIGVGLLLVGTSIGYAKLAPRLGARE